MIPRLTAFLALLGFLLHFSVRAQESDPIYLKWTTSWPKPDLSAYSAETHGISVSQTAWVDPAGGAACYSSVQVRETERDVVVFGQDKISWRNKDGVEIYTFQTTPPPVPTTHQDSLQILSYDAQSLVFVLFKGDSYYGHLPEHTVRYVTSDGSAITVKDVANSLSYDESDEELTFYEMEALPRSPYNYVKNEPTSSAFVFKRYMRSQAGTRVLGDIVTGVDGLNFTVRWNSVPGVSYQVESSADLNAWSAVGLPITGNGTVLSYANPLASAQKFYRVVLP